MMRPTLFLYITRDMLTCYLPIMVFSFLIHFLAPLSTEWRFLSATVGLASITTAAKMTRVISVRAAERLPLVSSSLDTCATHIPRLSTISSKICADRSGKRDTRGVEEQRQLCELANVRSEVILNQTEFD